MYNNVVLVGRICQEPELKQTPSNVSVCSFSLAVDRDFKTKGVEKQTDFLDCVIWRQQAEFLCRYGSKGSLILVDGSIQTRTYVDKEGKNRRVWEIQADKVKLLGKNEDTTQPTPAASQDAQPSYSSGGAEDFTELDDDGDLPF